MLRPSLMAEPMPQSGAEDGRDSARLPWVTPVLTRHASLSALTRFQDPSQPYVQGNSLIIGRDTIPCSGGFCP
jgi:hypothetical protein